MSEERVVELREGESVVIRSPEGRVEIMYCYRDWRGVKLGFVAPRRVGIWRTELFAAGIEMEEVGK